MTSPQTIRKTFAFSGEEFAAFFCPPKDRFFPTSLAAARREQSVKKWQKSHANTPFFVPSPTLSYKAQAHGIALELELTCDGVQKLGDSLCLWNVSLPEGDPLKETAALVACAVLCRKRDLPGILKKTAVLDPATGRFWEKEELLPRKDLDAFLDKTLSLAFSLLQEVCPQDTAARFLFPSLREGQRELMEECYAALREKRSLAVCAPTGLGKTVSFLYPGLRGIQKGRIRRVLFLTPKSSTQRQIAACVQSLSTSPRGHRCIVLFARQSACAHGGRCRKEECVLSQGSGERLTEALLALFSRFDVIFFDGVREVAREFSLCPFFLSQMAARLCDVIVGDYNFGFDPKARLDFLADGKTLLLADEAHNLPDRVSQSLSFAVTPSLCQALREHFPALTDQARDALGQLEDGFARRRKRLSEGGERVLLSAPRKTARACQALFSALRPLWDKDNEAAGELLYALRDFARACDNFSHGYVCSLGEDGSLKLCLCDPSFFIAQSAESFGSAVYFSATLLPRDYFFSALGGTSRDRFLEAASPFDPSRLKVCQCPVNTALSHRGESLLPLAKFIGAACEGRQRVLAFFPSFEYLQRAESTLKAFLPHLSLIGQKPGMKAKEQLAFLSRLEAGEPGRPLLGLCVLGGLFAEGVELKKEHLDGVIVVGTGRTPPSPEKEAAARYYAENGRDGNAYSYTLPGFHKVLQAAGRVIRREEDRGFVVLCDKHYADGSLAPLFPAHWNDPALCTTPGELRETLRRFWENQ